MTFHSQKLFVCFCTLCLQSAVAEKRSASQSLFPYSLYNTKPNAQQPSTTRAPIFYKRNTPQAMTEAQSLPLGVPAFKPLKTAATTNIQSILKKQPNEIPGTRKDALHQYPAPNLSAANLTFIQSQLAQNVNTIKTKPMVISPQANAFKVPVPAFQALPSSVSRIPSGQIVQTDGIRKSTTNNAIGVDKFSTIHRVDVGFVFH